MARTKVIGVICGEIHNIYQRDIVWGIAERAKKLGISVAVMCPDLDPDMDSHKKTSERGIIDMICLKHLDGVIYLRKSIPDTNHLEFIDRLLRKLHCPIVVLEDRFDRYTSVFPDDTSLMMELTEHFIVHHGMKKFMFLTGRMDENVSAQRLDGFLAALKKHRIKPSKKAIVYGDFWTGGVDEMVSGFVQHPETLPEAIICSNDTAAGFVIEELLRAGIRVPQDVSVAGFDGLAEYIGVPFYVTSAKRKNKGFGSQAMDEMYRLLYRTEVPYAPFEDSESIVFGNSCSCGMSIEHTLNMFGQYRARINRGKTMQKFYAMSRISSAVNLNDCAREMSEGLNRVLSFEEINICYLQGTKELLKYSFSYGLSQYPDAEAPFYQLMSASPKVYYFKSLYFNSQLYGYAAISFPNDCAQIDKDYNELLLSFCNQLHHIELLGQLKKSVTAQKNIALRDGTTGMFNKERFLEKASEYLEATRSGSKKLFLLLVRVENLGKLYERFGIDTGTEAVNHVAEAIMQVFQSGETCARLDNEIFGVIVPKDVPDKLISQYKALLSRNICAYNNQVEPDKGVVLVTADYYAHPGDSETTESLMEKLHTDLKNNVLEQYRHRTDKHYNDLVELRNRVYSSPMACDSVDVFCDEQGISKGHFYKIYAKYFGDTYQHEVIASRIAMAKQLLLTTTMQVKDIATECGYDDESYFSRQFKNETGTSPNQYRERV